MSQSKQTDPYKYFEQKFKNQGGQESSSDLSEDSQKVDVDVEDKYSQDEEYSLNNDDDFQLSASLKKSEGANTVHKLSTEARERFQKQQREEEAERRNKAIRDKVEAEMKKIDASESDSNGSNIDQKSGVNAYDYFLNKEKPGHESESESDFSKTSVAVDVVNENKVETFKVHEINSQTLQPRSVKAGHIEENIQSDDEVQEDIMNVSVPSSSAPVRSPLRSQTEIFSVHDAQQTYPGNSTVNKGSVVPGAVQMPTFLKKTSQYSPEQAAQMKEIEEQLNEIQPRYPLPKQEKKEMSKSRPKTSTNPGRSNSKVAEKSQKQKEEKSTERQKKLDPTPEQKKKRPQSSKIIFSDKNNQTKKDKAAPVPSQIPSHRVKMGKAEEPTNLQIVTGQPAREDPTNALKKSEKFQKLLKIKQTQDKQKRVKSPPKFTMKYRGRSASDVFEEDLPKVVEDGEVQEEIGTAYDGAKNLDANTSDIPGEDFEEALQEEGDQSMPAQSAPEAIKSKRQTEAKTKTDKALIQLKPLKKQQPAIKEKAVEQKPKTKVKTQTIKAKKTPQVNQEFGFEEQQLDAGDQAMPQMDEFAEQELGNGDQAMPDEEDPETPPPEEVEPSEQAVSQRRSERPESSRAPIQQPKQLVKKEENEVPQTERCITCQNKPKTFVCTHPIDKSKLPFGAKPKSDKLVKDEVTLKAEADEALRIFKDKQKEWNKGKEGGDPAVNNFMKGLQNQMKAQVDQQKKASLNPLVTAELKKEVITKSQRKPMFNPVDDLDVAKQIQDLTAQLKQSFFENKTIQKNTVDFEKKRRNYQVKLERIMKDKNLVRINGVLQAKPDSNPAYRRKMTNEDIPDFDKVKESENPLELIATKFEAKGYLPADLFMAFDYDNDDVLTIQEIKDGLRTEQIELSDTEMKALVDAIDANHDGVCTEEEWVKLFKIKFDAQREYIKAMGNIDINDPLDLEERVLDLQFKKRRLDNEVRLMRKQKKSEDYFKNLKIKEEHKVLRNRIEELELKSKQKQNLNEEDRETFQTGLSKGLQSRADLEQEKELLQKQRAEIEIKYNEMQHKHTEALFTFDQRYRTINDTANLVRQDRDMKRIQLRSMQVQLENERELEKKLDKEIESILGRACTQADLDALYMQDLALLNQIDCGLNNKISEFKTIIAALKLQKAWRGKMARKKYNSALDKKRMLEIQSKQLQYKGEELRKFKAALAIQRAWRRHKYRREEYQRLQKRNSLRRERQDKELTEQRQIFRSNMLVKKIQRYWRAKKQARLSGVANPFKGAMFKLPSQGLYGKGDTVQLATEVDCATCKNETASFQCKECGSAFNQCNDCFTELHKRGQRKRHAFKRIVYGAEDEQDVENMPLRDNTFAQSSAPKSSLKSADDSILSRQSEQQKKVQFVQSN